MSFVAILALIKRKLYFCELINRDCARTGYKCYIMVKALPIIKDEDESMSPAGEEGPDYGQEENKQPPQNKNKDAWRMPTYDECEHFLRDSVKKKGVHPIDPIAIACKSDPIPLKDIRDNGDKWLKSLSDGWYGGNPIIETLKKQEFETIIDNKRQKVCRWAVIKVDEDLRNFQNLVGAELKAQKSKFHGEATIKAAVDSIQPNTLSFLKDGSQIPIIAIRMFHGGPQQAMNEYVYFVNYGLFTAIWPKTLL